VRNEEVLHKVKDDGDILLTRKRNKFNIICLIFRKNCLPKHVMKGREGEGENVSSYWMILRKMRIVEIESGSTRWHFE